MWTLGDLLRELALLLALTSGAMVPATETDWWDGCDREHRLTVPAKGANTYVQLPDGRTLGTLPGLGTDPQVNAAPDLVRVVGDGGAEGYADSCYVLGKGEQPPRTPAEALTLQKTRPVMTIPVYASDGVRIIDVFTIRPHAPRGG